MRKFEDLTLREQREALAKLRLIVLALEVERLLHAQEADKGRGTARYLPDKNGDWDPNLLS